MKKHQPLTKKKPNLLTRQHLFQYAHGYARRLLVESSRHSSYPAAFAEALREVWQAGRCWKQTPVGIKHALRMRFITEGATKKGSQATDDQDALQFDNL